MFQQNPSLSAAAGRSIRKVGSRAGRKSNSPLELFLAGKIRSIIGTAGTSVFCHLRIRAERPHFVDLSVRHMPGDDMSRFLIQFNPVFDHFHSVEVVLTGTTAAVVHSWNHKERDG